MQPLQNPPFCSTPDEHGKRKLKEIKDTVDTVERAEAKKEEQ
jgi:hypothetical protein